VEGRCREGGGRVEGGWREAMLQIAEPAMTHFLHCSPSCAEMCDMWHSNGKKGHKFNGTNQGCLHVPGA